MKHNSLNIDFELSRKQIIKAIKADFITASTFLMRSE